MKIFPSEEIVELSHNFSPDALDGMKTEMRLFGDGKSAALKTDLKARLGEKIKNHGAGEILDHLMYGITEYISIIYDNYYEYNSNIIPNPDKGKKNLDAFWRFMNSFLLDLVERPLRVDSILLEKPAQDILSAFFEKIGYRVEFNIYSLFPSQFPFFTVTVAKLLSIQLMKEQMFGFPIAYTLEHIESIRPSTIFGLSGHFDPEKTIIRIDHNMTDFFCRDSLGALLEEEIKFMEETTQRPYNEILLEHLLFREKLRCLFHMLEQDYYSKKDAELHEVLDFLSDSEVWVRLASLYLSNGAIIYELNSLLELRRTSDPLYFLTYKYLKDFTSIFEVFNDNNQSLNAVILSCRSYALENLKIPENFLHRHIDQEPSDRWAGIIRLMQQEYGRDASCCTMIYEKYRPVFNAR